MDLRRLHHAMLLAEELSFSRAAERAYLSQTAFSRSIQSLEAEFGVRLFDRDTRSVRPTLVGSRLVARGKTLLSEAADISRELSLFNSAEAGDLSFGVSGMALDAKLRGQIVAFNRLHPKLRLHIEVGDWKLLRAQLEEDRIEFFIAYPADLADNPKFKVTPLEGRHASTFCRAGHPLLTRGAPVVPANYLAYPWAAVQLADEFSATFRKVCGLGKDDPLPLALSCSNTSLLREAALHTDALLFTWRDWLIPDLDAGRLVDIGTLLEPRHALGDRLIHCAVVQRAGRTCSPAAQRAMEEILSDAAEHGAPSFARRHKKG